MAPPTPSYTKPSQPPGKVILITGASGGVGCAKASSFAASGLRDFVLLGRRTDALAKTTELVRSSYGELAVQTHEVDPCDESGVPSVMNSVTGEFGDIDLLVHCAGVLAPVVPLLDADSATFLGGYKTTVGGTLVVAQAVVLANKKVSEEQPTHERKQQREITFIKLTTAGILFLPFPGIGAYVSSKMAAVKILQSFGAENPHVRLHNVHPAFLLDYGAFKMRCVAWVDELRAKSRMTPVLNGAPFCHQTVGKCSFRLSVQ